MLKAKSPTHSQDLTPEAEIIFTLIMSVSSQSPTSMITLVGQPESFTINYVTFVTTRKKNPAH